ncbi:MAG: 1-deoxy-D-xylulose-5-phosphate synthase, partial [Ruminiclostridium sp.]
LCLNEAVYNNNGVVAVRYPRGFSIDEGKQEYSDYEYSGKNSDTLLISYGREANLIKGVANTDSLTLTKILPINEDIISIALCYKRIFFFEEGIRSGGIGEKLLCRLFSSGFRGNYEIVAVEDRFVKAADVEAQLCESGLDRKSIEERVKNGERKADI